MKRNMVSRYVATGLAAMGVCMATGCATTDTVSSRFPQLEENINAAKAAEAVVYAPTPLQSAEVKLEQARSAVKAKDMVSASRFVDEAMVDADYARAKAPTEKAKYEAKKLREAIQAVRDEIKKMPAVK
jgi:uncharacterized surface protein with fasciclin (FAS1) repeats